MSYNKTRSSKHCNYTNHPAQGNVKSRNQNKSNVREDIKVVIGKSKSWIERQMIEDGWCFVHR